MTIDHGRRRTLGMLLAGAVTASPIFRSGAAWAIPGPLPGPGSGPAEPVVSVARREGLITADGTLDKVKLEAGLGAAVARAAGEKGPVEAMRSLFKPSDVVGIKLNCIAGRGLSPRPTVALQLAQWLIAAGISPDRILIWDRTDRELKNAEYSLNQGSGIRISGTNDQWDEKVIEWGPSASRFSKTLVNDLTALINLGVLKDHGLAGISLGMKNWYGVINNPNKCHEEGCHPFIPHLAASPLIKNKLRLTVIDGVTGQCHAGPSRSPRWAWPFQGFLASKDPVALDAAGWKIIEARRQEVGLKPLAAENRAPRYIAAAAKLGLGVDDPAKFQFQDV